MIQGFKHSSDIQLRYSDFDMMQHLNNAAYSTFFELARVNYLIDVLKWNFQTEVTNVVASINIDFKIPVFPSDRPKVYSRVSKIGRSSFVFEHIMAEEQEEGNSPKIFASASTVQVCINQQMQMPVDIPNGYRQNMVDFDNPEVK